MFQQPFEQFLSEDITTQIQQWEARNSSGTDEMGEGCKSDAVVSSVHKMNGVCLGLGETFLCHEC